MGQEVFSLGLGLFVLVFWLCVLFPDIEGLSIAALSIGGVFLAGWLAKTIGSFFTFAPENRDRVLQYSVDLQFLDPEGERASLHIVRLFRCWAKFLRTYEWRFRADNGLSDVSVSPGTVTEETKHLGQHRITQDFGTIAPRWRLFHIEFRGIFGKAFTNPQGEFWETFVSMPTKELQIQITFHPERPPDPDSFTIREVIGFAEFDVPRAKLELRKGAGPTVATVSLKQPKHFATYRIAWNWINTTR